MSSVTLASELSPATTDASTVERQREQVAMRRNFQAARGEEKPYGVAIQRVSETFRNAARQRAPAETLNAHRAEELHGALRPSMPLNIQS